MSDRVLERRWALHAKGFLYSVEDARWWAGDNSLSDDEIDRFPEDVWQTFLDDLPKRVRRLRDIVHSHPKQLSLEEATMIAQIYGATIEEVQRSEVLAMLNPPVPLGRLARDSVKFAERASEEFPRPQ